MTPSPIKPGDTIAVVAPSGPVDREQLEPALSYLKSRGYVIHSTDTLFQRDRYLAGSDVERAADLNRMFADPEVRAIFVARGGYGSARLLDKLDYALIGNNPKIMLGFSDTTALQLGILAKTGLVTYSGITLCQDITNEGMSKLLEDSLWPAVEKTAFADITGLEVLQAGTGQGPLIGGCLSLICSLVGTPYMPDLNHAILVIEDVNEEPYKIDRMLTQLRLSNVFAKIGGLVIGQFTNCIAEDDRHGQMEPIIGELKLLVDGPVVSGLLYGHGQDRIVLPIGAPIRISTDDDNTGHVEFLASAGSVVSVK